MVGGYVYGLQGFLAQDFAGVKAPVRPALSEFGHFLCLAREGPATSFILLLQFGFRLLIFISTIWYIRSTRAHQALSPHRTRAADGAQSA